MEEKTHGAVGYIKEKDGVLVMATACKDYLEANGVEARMSRYIDEDEGLNEKINECNAYNPDLAGDIHLNAGGGDGAEVFYSVVGGTGKTLAQNVLNEICELGQQSRGIKTKVNSSGRDYFGFIRSTKCPAVITEAYFVDNAEDVQIGDTVEEQKIIGIAIAKGFLKTLGIESRNDVPEAPVVPVNDKKEVIRSLQHAYNVSYGTNLEEDGIKGPKTEAVMKKYYLKNYTANELARWVQDRLLNHKGYALTVDGKYGKDSERVVKQFQRDNNKVVDGLAGYETINILI